jgi:hypothetical protein
MQNAQFLNVKASGTYSSHSALIPHCWLSMMQQRSQACEFCRQFTSRHIKVKGHPKTGHEGPEGK